MGMDDGEEVMAMAMQKFGAPEQGRVVIDDEAEERDPIEGREESDEEDDGDDAG